MTLEQRKERISVVKNGLDFLENRVKELLEKESYEESDKGIIKEVIKLIPEHEAELEKLNKGL